jgi:hypothetical protein
LMCRGIIILLLHLPQCLCRTHLNVTCLSRHSRGKQDKLPTPTVDAVMRAQSINCSNVRARHKPSAQYATAGLWHCIKCSTAPRVTCRQHRWSDQTVHFFAHSSHGKCASCCQNINVNSTAACQKGRKDGMSSCAKACSCRGAASMRYYST